MSVKSHHLSGKWAVVSKSKHLSAFWQIAWFQLVIFVYLMLCSSNLPLHYSCWLLQEPVEVSKLVFFTSAAFLCRLIIDLSWLPLSVQIMPQFGCNSLFYCIQSAFLSACFIISQFSIEYKSYFNDITLHITATLMFFHFLLLSKTWIAAISSTVSTKKFYFSNIKQKNSVAKSKF